MDHIIIEGADQSGKSTLINGLKESYDKIKVVHFSTPEGNTNEEKTTFQKLFFDTEWMKATTEDMKMIPTYDAIFWDRSHLGEAVYGPMYRSSNPSWIFKLEEKHLDEVKQQNTFMFLLECDIDLLQSKDDGESLSANDRSKITDEQHHFRVAFYMSNIRNKHIITVDDGNGNYKPKEDILNEVKKIIMDAKRTGN